MILYTSTGVSLGSIGRVGTGLKSSRVAAISTFYLKN
jgi:hypothetical protein